MQESKIARAREQERTARAREQEIETAEQESDYEGNTNIKTLAHGNTVVDH